ncbi:sensor histidine kinase [Oscillibacter sp.]|uniref:sensor histidine kinase n=1 Tax=Oscillibacter sp. TaxID=1945593 RepID=UPI002D80DC71|nr:GHKL domain-containing protein [Oscillibacter sp.]
MERILNFLSRMGEFLWTCLQDWPWFFLLLASGFFLFQLVSAFLPVKPRRGWRAGLVVFLGVISGQIIWLGDPNLLFSLLAFVPVLLLASKGDRTGRLAVTVIFFCLIMPVNAALDTYCAPIMAHYGLDDVYYCSEKFIRLAVWGGLYLGTRKRLPQTPPQLSPRFWRLVLLLAAMPFSALLAVVLLTFEGGIGTNSAAHSLTMNLGVTVLPFVFLTALALLYAILVLEDHERLEQADKLASLRESYYQGLRREERQLRTLRHDLRNHLTALRGLVELGEDKKALQYMDQLADSPALRGGKRLCENDAANAVLSAKAEAMGRSGLTADISATLPKSLPLGDADLCALLGNALDNAMEAAERAEDKTVLLRCRAEKGLFMLRVENAYTGELSPDLATTKADKAAHGFGLVGMREIAERLGGSLEVRAVGGRFQLIVSLPLSP